MCAPMDVLDPRALDSLLALIGGGTAGLRRVASTFVEETGAIVRDMRLAADAGDVPALHRGAHTVRTAARYVGAGRLERLASELEAFASDATACRGPAWSLRATGSVEAIGAAFEEACRALESRMEAERDATD